MVTVADKPQMATVLWSRGLAVVLVFRGYLDHVPRSGSRALSFPVSTEMSHALRCRVLVNAYEPTGGTPTSANPGCKWSDGLSVAWKGAFARFPMRPLSRPGRRLHVHRVSMVTPKKAFVCPLTATTKPNTSSVAYKVLRPSTGASYSRDMPWAELLEPFEMSTSTTGGR